MGVKGQAIFEQRKNGDWHLVHCSMSRNTRVIEDWANALRRNYPRSTFIVADWKATSVIAPTLKDGDR